MSGHSRLVIVGLLMAEMMLVGCRENPEPAGSAAADSAAVPTTGGLAVVALPDEPGVLNSLIRTSAVAGTVLSLLQASLAEMGEDLAWQPMIADQWTVAADSLAITYHLRPWSWEDGRSLTAVDVQRSFELFRDPRIGSPRSDLLRAVTGVVVLDSVTIRYEFSTPQTQPVQTTVHAILPAHRTADLDPSDVANWPLNRAPVASGPFRLADWEQGHQLVLESNPRYPLARPWLDRVVLRIMPDQTARLLALETGEVDLVADVPAAAADRLARDPEISLREISGRVFGFVMWNVRRPTLADPHVRKALSLALDRRRFVDDLLGGRGTPAASYLTPALWNHHPDLPADPCLPDSARALLAAAGWVDRNGDGVRERDGRALSIEIIYRGGDSLRESGAAVVQQNLGAVGVRVDLRALELATALDFLRSGRFDAYFGEFQANLYADPSPLVMSGATDRFNFGGYGNARVDSLLTLALAEADRTRSRPLWYAIQEELAADQPAAVLYYPRQIVAVNRRIRDVRPHMLSAVNNIHEWWIAPENRRWATAPTPR